MNVIFALMFNPKRSKLMKNIPLVRPKAILIVLISKFSQQEVNDDNACYQKGNKGSDHGTKGNDF